MPPTILAILGFRNYCQFGAKMCICVVASVFSIRGPNPPYYGIVSPRVAHFDEVFCQNVFDLQISNSFEKLR